MTDLLSHEDQVAILEDALAELAKQWWHEWTYRPTPYEVSLRRKTGLFARQFMSVWVEDDGELVTHFDGEAGRLPFGL